MAELDQTHTSPSSHHLTAAQTQYPQLFDGNGELQLGTSTRTAGTCSDLYEWFDDTLKGVTKDEFCSAIPSYRHYYAANGYAGFVSTAQQDWHACFALDSGFDLAHEWARDFYMLEDEGHASDPPTCGYVRDLGAAIDKEWPYAMEGVAAGAVGFHILKPFRTDLRHPFLTVTLH